MIDLKDFKVRKEAGIVKIEAKADMLYIKHKKFDPMTGLEVGEEVSQIDPPTVKKALDEAKEKVKTLQDLYDEVVKVDTENKIKIAEEEAKKPKI